MIYSLKLAKQVEKFIGKQDKVTRQRLLEAVFELRESPKIQHGSAKMEGYENLYRKRVGKYRIVYRIIDEILTVSVIDVDSRGDIYKRY